MSSTQIQITAPLLHYGEHSEAEIFVGGVVFMEIQVNRGGEKDAE